MDVDDIQDRLVQMLKHLLCGVVAPCYQHADTTTPQNKVAVLRLTGNQQQCQCRTDNNSPILYCFFTLFTAAHRI